MTTFTERLPGRNEPCWCGSGRKYKACHMQQDNRVALFTAQGHTVPTHALLKTPEQLRRLHEAGLGRVYLGVETGDSELLSKVKKGFNFGNMRNEWIKCRATFGGKNIGYCFGIEDVGTKSINCFSRKSYKAAVFYRLGCFGKCILRIGVNISH